MQQQQFAGESFEKGGKKKGDGREGERKKSHDIQSCRMMLKVLSKDKSMWFSSLESILYICFCLFLFSLRRNACAPLTQQN